MAHFWTSSKAYNEKMRSFRSIIMSNEKPVSENVSVPHEKGVHLVRTVTVNRPISDAYRFWHDLSRLPEVFKYIKSIQFTGENKAHVELSLPGNISTEFDAEIYTDVPN